MQIVYFPTITYGDLGLNFLEYQLPYILIALITALLIIGNKFHILTDPNKITTRFLFFLSFFLLVLIPTFLRHSTHAVINHVI